MKKFGKYPNICKIFFGTGISSMTPDDLRLKKADDFEAQTFF
jgi:hypothetical protein